jgi:FtsP/CotA-like multicopper oxidase with cupredoxin domain
VLAAAVSKGVPVNLSVIPPEIIDVCTPSQGDREVISVTKKAQETEKWVAIDIIGAYSLITAVFSIDNLPMYIYAVDGEYIVPQLVEAISVANGDRYQILVKLDAPGDFPMRQASTANSQILADYAILSYRVEGSTSALQQTTPFILNNGVPVTPATVFYSQANQKQFDPPELVAQHANQEFKLFMRVTGASFEWAMNSSQFPAALLDYGQEPVVLFNPQPWVQDNVTITTLNDTWVDLVIITATLPMPPHPIHKHGNKMWLLVSAGPHLFHVQADLFKNFSRNFFTVDQLHT